MSLDPATPASQTERPFLCRSFLRTEAPADFEQAMNLRINVFVQEQNVPVELEQDEFDDEALHWVLLHPETQEVVATARIQPYQEACQARPVAKIGRVAVNSSFRGQRLGERLMREILNYCHAEGYEYAILDAQTRVLPFYEKLGFVREGFEFMDAGIPHYRMRLALSSI